jgi:hypothetical protein
MPFSFDPNKHFNDGVSEDFFRLMIGERLGQGLYRDVYEFTYNDSYVIKIETGECSFANILEWEVWQSVRYNKKISHWFAPCYKISPRGQFLIQQKTSQINTRHILPKNIPSFFDDLHMGNWGLIEGKWVCHDYANHKAFSNDFNFKMVKAKWSVK